MLRTRRFERRPGWHPDPTGRHRYREWNGERWTEHVSDFGTASIDPLDDPKPKPTPKRSRSAKRKSRAGVPATATPTTSASTKRRSRNERGSHDVEWRSFWGKTA